MGFNPAKYRIQTHPEYTRLLNEALDAENGIFVPCDTSKEVRGFKMAMGRHRAAWETQHFEDKYEGKKYDLVTFKEIKHQGQLGLLIYEVDGSEQIEFVRV